MNQRLLFTLLVCLPVFSFAQAAVQQRLELKRLELENKYRWVGRFDASTGIATFYNEGQMGYIDTNGKQMLPLGEWVTNDFNEGRGVYYESRQKVYKLVDKKGKVLKEYRGLSFLRSFKNGLAIVADTSKKINHYGVMDLYGNFIIRCQYAYIEKISEKYYKVDDWDKGWGIINTAGDTVIPLKYNIDYIDTATLDFIGYRKDTGFAIFNAAGHVKKYLGKNVYDVSSAIEGMHYYQRNGVIIVKDRFEDGANYAAVNLSFDTIVPLGRYRHLGEINEGMIKFSDSVNVQKLDERVTVSQHVKCGFLNTRGEVVIPAVFDFAQYFTEGLSAVRRNNKYGYINQKGEIVIPLTYDYALPFRSGYAKVQMGDKFYIIDKKGQIVLNSKTYR